MAFLIGITAPDLSIEFKNGEHFSATQEMTEEFRQEITYQGAFGTDGPLLRRKRNADEGTLSFSAVLLKAGVQGAMNDEKKMLTEFTDFEVHVVRGGTAKTYRGCNWNRISIRSTLDNVTLDADITVPGYTGVGPVPLASTFG